MIALWKIEENSESLLKELDLKPKEQKIYSRFRVENRKQEWLAVRLLTKTIFGEYVKIKYSKRGRPKLKKLDWNISISHKNEFVGVILGRNMRLALDIELLSDKVEKISNKFLTETEIVNIDKNDRNFQLHLLWCAKECLLKLTGKPNLDFKKNFYIHPIKTNQKFFWGEIRPDTKSFQKSKIYYEKINNNYVLTWSLMKKQNLKQAIK